MIPALITVAFTCLFILVMALCKSARWGDDAIDNFKPCDSVPADNPTSKGFARLGLFHASQSRVATETTPVATGSPLNDHRIAVSGQPLEINRKVMKPQGVRTSERGTFPGESRPRMRTPEKAGKGLSLRELMKVQVILK